MPNGKFPQTMRRSWSQKRKCEAARGGRAGTRLAKGPAQPKQEEKKEVEEAIAQPGSK